MTVRLASNGLPQAAPKALVVQLDRRGQALALRREGKSYERIGEILHIRKQTAHELVMNAIKDRRAEMAEDIDAVRELELERLDRLLRTMLKRLDDPTNDNPERTSDSIVRLMERRAAMIGLDAPKDWRLGGIPGGEPIGINNQDGDINLPALTVEQLQSLEGIVALGHRIAVVPAPVALENPHPSTSSQHALDQSSGPDNLGSDATPHPTG